MKIASAGSDRPWPLVGLIALLALFFGRDHVFGAAPAHPADGPHVDVRIAIDPDALRMQLTMNIVFLDEALTFQREQLDRIDPIEGPALLDALQEWADADLPVLIDGIEVTPIVDQLMISEPDDSRLALFPKTGMRGLRKIRFEITWPFKSPPAEIEFEWPVYPPDISIDPEDPPSLEIAAELSAEGVREAVYFTVDSPIWLWRSGSTAIDERLERIPVPTPSEPWRLPVVSIAFMLGGLLVGLMLLIPARTGSSIAGLAVMIACGVGSLLLGGVAVVDVAAPGASAFRLPTNPQAQQIFVPLHANIYRAFDYVRESDIYDALERSVEGELLDELYRTIHRSLVLEEEQGALSRVIAVRPVHLEVESATVRESGDSEVAQIGFEALFRWQVDGRVTHWGHVHERTNEYLARFDVVGARDGWRIAAVELLEQERVDQNLDPDAPDETPPAFDIDDDDFEL